MNNRYDTRGTKMLAGEKQKQIGLEDVRSQLFARTEGACILQNVPQVRWKNENVAAREVS
jgi:hypothetical protein